MDNSVLFTSLAGVTVSLALYYLLRTKVSRYPPGPLAFPVVGNLPQLSWTGSLTAFANHYRKIYGDVFTFTFGRNVRVVISGYDAMHDLLVKNADFTSFRTANLLSRTVQEKSENTPGLLWAPFPHWKTLRSFIINTLREERMGKASLELEVQEEIEHYLSTFIEPNVGKPMKLRRSLSQATSNILSQMMFGRRKDYDDEQFNKLTRAIEESFAPCIQDPGMLGNSFGRSAERKNKDNLEKTIWPILQSYVSEQKTGLDKKNPRHLTDRFLIYSDKEGKDPCFSEENLRMFALQVYFTGTDTTAAALTWALLFMCLHPGKQERVQREIDQHLVGGRTASWKDRAEMPYIDAVLLETLRKGNIVPASLPHTVEKDLIIQRTLIPAGAELMLNMSSVLNDETVFEEPDKFKPERYLTGDIALKKQRTIPFGIGQRACLGESLAKMELFLFFTTFLQKYSVRLPEGSTASEETVESVIRSPKLFDIIFTRR